MSDFDRTQMANANATQMVMNVTCPVCKTANPGGEQYCVDCGFLLSSEPVDAAEVLTPAVMAKLVEVSTGREFLLKPGVNTIGRQDADVLISHPTVSRSHAKLTVSDGSYLLEDVGSTNGTFIGSRKVEPGQPVELENGTEILFGSASMRLETPAEDDAVSGAEAALEVEEAEELEQLEEESVQLEAAAEAPPADVAEESEVVEVEDGDITSESDATPEQSLEEPVEAVEIHEEEPTVARLVHASGGDEFIVKPGENTVGRRPANDITIADPYVSGSHAVITASDGSFSLTDIGSTNGTLVNGERLAPNEPRELQDGDEITFAQVAFRFTI